MLRKTLISIGVGLIAIAVFFALPPVRAEIAWMRTAQTDTPEAYEAYLAEWDGRHSDDALGRLDAVMWDKASAAQTLEGVEAYIERFPQGAHADEADVLHEQLMWEDTREKGTEQAYRAFIDAHPDSKHLSIAQACADEACWLDAQSKKSRSAYQAYLTSYPKGAHAAEAANAIDDCCWQEACDTASLNAYLSYLEEYPNGRHVADATAKKQAILSDDAPFLEACKSGTPEAFEEFLQSYPGHVRTNDAKTAIQDLAGRDMFDLMNENKIGVRIDGEDIDSIGVEIQRHVAYPIRVLIPVGTYFTARSSSVQSMMVIEQTEVTLDTDEWTYVSPSVACTNIARAIPEEGDAFGVARVTNSGLLALAKTIGSASEPVYYDVAQAAIWIVADNADWDYLGILVSTDWSGSQTRVIDEDEAAEAMRLCETAGIPITTKAIWRDRSTILSGVTDEELRAWLESKG